MDETVQVGYISRAHGIKGEVLVNLTSNVLDRMSPGSTLYTISKTLTILSSSPHQGKWIVHFEGIDTRTQAENLRGTVLKAVPLDSPDELWVDDLVGLDVIDQGANNLGKVTEVESNPASDLLVLESGHLIPLTFVELGDKHYRISGKVYVNIPEGLLESEF